MAFGNSLLRPIYRYRHCRFELQCELHCLMHVARGIVQHTRLHFRYPYYTHRLTTLSRPLLPCIVVTLRGGSQISVFYFIVFGLSHLRTRLQPRV